MTRVSFPANMAGQRGESPQRGPVLSEVVNLRRARKHRKRLEKEARAEENRTRFGRAKSVRRRDAEEQKRAERDFQGKKID